MDDLYLGKLGEPTVDPTPETPQEPAPDPSREDTTSAPAQSQQPETVSSTSAPAQNQQTVTVSSTSAPTVGAETKPATAAAGTAGEIPQTGDTLPVAALALSMVLSALALLGLVLLRRKSKQSVK